MLIEVENLSFNVEFNKQEINKTIPVLFLHGFTGSSKDWYFLKDKLPKGFSHIFIDLIGHGKSSSPQNLNSYSHNAQVKFLRAIVSKLELKKFVLVGYSMGGRLALQYATIFPESILGLLLESTSFGIYLKSQRQVRVRNDEKLAKEIQSSQLKIFIRKWMDTPLFNSLKNVGSERFNELYSQKVNSNNKTGLSNSLKGFSTGRMKYYGRKKLPVKNVFLITGNLDEKYTNISKKYSQIKSNTTHRIIQGAGHNTHFEKPKDFLKLLNKFLNSIKDNL